MEAVRVDLEDDWIIGLAVVDRDLRMRGCDFGAVRVWLAAFGLSALHTGAQQTRAGSVRDDGGGGGGGDSLGP